MKCQSCNDPNCLNCTGTASSQCISCDPTSQFKNLYLGNCVVNCPIFGYYADTCKLFYF